MRAFVSTLVTLCLAAPAWAGDPARELVVQLSSAALAPDGAVARAAQPGALPAAVRARLGALGLRASRALAEQLSAPRVPLPDVYGFHPERIVLVEAPDSALATSALAVLAGDALVDWAERNVTREALLVRHAPAPQPNATTQTTTLDTLANDPYLRGGRQYGLWNPGPTGFFGGVARADVHAPEAWRVCVGSNALKLAVADTGIDPDQPELGGLMPDGSPRITDALNATDDPDRSVTDLHSHGTIVTGVIAARTNDGAHFAPNTGVAGVCGGDGAGNAGCRIVPIKIAPGHSGEASAFDIARAYLHAADVGARAINLSFAGDTPSRVERLALTYALFNGCIPVCAAGNSGYDEPKLLLFPAAYAVDGLTLSVGASDSFDQRTVWSSYPDGLDLVAPGLNIYSTYMTYPSFNGVSYPGYVIDSGTSLSAPFVTGAVGLLAAARSDLIDTDYQHVIRESADDIGAPGFDEQTAHGRLNLQRMLARVGPEIGVWHDEIAADSFTVEGRGLLAVGESSPGTLGLHLGTHASTRIAAYGTASIPDSFLTVTGVWLRVAGTLAARGDFSMPYFAPSASVLRSSATSVTFRGYVYRVEQDSCDVCDDRFVPLAPSNVRFGFTVMGVVDRPPRIDLVDTFPHDAGLPGELCGAQLLVSDPDTVSRVVLEFEPQHGARVLIAEARTNLGAPSGPLPCLGPADTPGRLVVTAYDDRGHTDQASVSVPFTLRAGACSAPLVTFRVTPSPFVSALDVFAPGAGTLRVLDASGRVVRRLETPGGAVHWDGRDERGTLTAAGVYWVRYDGAAGTVTRRVVKLGR